MAFVVHNFTLQLSRGPASRINYMGASTGLLSEVVTGWMKRTSYNIHFHLGCNWRVKAAYFVPGTVLGT